ncbi:MAG: hypothetical protein ACREEU_02315 [Acetobacteraceae bacterium]
MPGNPLPAAPAKVPDPQVSDPKAPDPQSLFWIVLRFLFCLPALAPLAAFLFASFWFASGVLLGVGTISLGWLGAFAAMLAFDCLPEGALTGGPFGLVRRLSPRATGAAAAREFGLALFLDFYLLYSAVFWVFAATLLYIAARLFLS